jgi:predicted RNA binding protein YcfA (HicA-like mRNA interferase family)
VGAALSADIWRQLKGITAGELCRALDRDGWQLDTRGGSQYIYRKAFADQTVRRVSVHVHPQKTFGPALLKSLLADIGWTAEDCRRLKIVK